MNVFIISSLFFTILLGLFPLPHAQFDGLIPANPPFFKEISIQNAHSESYLALFTNIPPDVDLIISLASAEQTAPKIFVSKSNPSPSSSENSDYNSVNFAGSVISIPYRELVTTSQLYIGLFCSIRTCEASLSIKFFKELSLFADGQSVTHRNDIVGISAAIVRLRVPEASDTNRLLIHVDAIPTDDTSMPVLNMYVAKGRDIPSINHAINIPRYAWYEGKTTVIYQGSDQFCTNCDYTLSLEFDQNSELRLEAHVLPLKTRLSKRSFLDAVQREKYNIYVYEVPEVEKHMDVVIDLQAQEGSLVLYIDCGLEPEDYSRFKMSYSSGKVNEQIVLTAEDHGRCQGLRYTIVVYGREHSVYSIKASRKEVSELRLSKEAPIMGSILPHELIDYELSVPLYLTEKIIVKLETKGNADLSVVNCRFPSECPSIMSENYVHIATQSSNVSSFESTYQLEALPEGKQVTIDLKKGTCYAVLLKKGGLMRDEEADAPICAFKVTLRGSKDAMQPEEYVLSAVLEGHQVIYSSRSEHGTVSEDETLYYLMHVPQESLMSLSFQLTVLSGKAELFVSRNNPYPTSTEEATVDHEGFITFRNLESYNGTYYAAVKGIMKSSFILTPTAISSNAQPEDYSTTLEDGVPHKGVLLIKNNENPEQFYKFKVNEQESWKGKIRITVTPLRGSLIITVTNNNNVPTVNLGDWVVHGNTLEILSTEEKFKRQNVYHVGLYVNEEDPASAGLKEITYTIAYTLISTETTASGGESSINKNHIVLTTALAHHGVVRSGNTLYFKIFVEPTDNSLTFFKKANAGDVDIYLSTDPMNKYPGPQRYTHTTAQNHKDSIALEKSDLDQACGDHSTNAVCRIYLSVTTSSKDDVPFTISAQKSYSEEYGLDASATPLEDGKEREFKIPANQKEMMFYFYPAARQDTIVDVFCPEKDIYIYANVQRLQVANEKLDFKFPESQDALYSSISNVDLLNTGAAHLVVPADPDFSTLAVIIWVKFEDPSRTPKSGEATTFSIVASSTVREIYTGKPYHGNVEQGSYTYFHLSVNKPNCTLVIALTTIDGDADLFVSFGRYTRPTVEDHKFASGTRQRTEILELSPIDMYPSSSMQGDWVIAVYGKRASRFVVSAAYEEEKMLQLYEAIPMEMYIKKDATIYFKYFHKKETAFNIRVDKQSGDVAVYVKTLDQDQDIPSNLPNSSNYVWTIDHNKQSVLKIQPYEENGCQNCLYLIGIQGIQASKFSLLVHDAGKFTVLQDSLRYSDQLQPLETRKYMLMFKSLDKLSLSASLSSGQLDVYVFNNPIVNSTFYSWDLHLTPDNTYGVLDMEKADFEKKQHMASIWDGQDFVLSQKNIFYFQFENPSKFPSEYSFSIHSPDTSVVLHSNKVQDFIFKDGEERSFLYYSPHITGSVNLAMSYCLITDKGESLDDKLTELLEGFDFVANYWNQKSTAGKGSEITPIKNNIVVDDVQNSEKGESISKETSKETSKEQNICVKQRIEIEDQEQEGRYEFLIRNPHPKTLEVSIRVDTTELNFKKLDRNSHDLEKLEPKQKKLYEIVIPGSGYWYLDVFACSGTFLVEFADSLEAIQSEQMKQTPISQFGGKRELFYRGKTDEAGGKRYLYITANEASENFGDKTADALLSFSYFNEENAREYQTTSNIDALGPLHDPKLTHKYEFDYEDSNLVVKFNPVKIMDGSSQDTLVFYMRLCPKGVLRNRENHCVPYVQPEECFSAHQSSNPGSDMAIEQAFERVPPGDYELHIFGRVNHNNDLVRSYAYKTVELTLGEPFLNKIWDVILFFITVGLISLCLCFAFQRLKKSQQQQGFNMRVFKKTREYGFVGDEEDDDDLKHEDADLRRRDSN